ncbi:hypothetical protein Pla175_50100 [Pirellulimonas nuda]|uniref:DUF58 domain-containing protein n=1 Tax=Pirellulimonas nuda TaxID=2528009 RepID=A0A518DJC7_9BACT|nr:DUF58 domain-containing protein [Pirellulimonas nuda]QDU91580.1 hypothetical protein Pla175_50100 [Pirellulimonas nuda]
MPFLWTLLAVAAALLGLARLGSVYPHRPLVAALYLPAVLAVALLRWPEMWPAVALVDAAIGIAALVDVFSLPRARDFACERRVGLIASLGKHHPVTLTLSNSSATGRPVWVCDGAESDLNADPSRFTVVLPPLSRSVLRYQLRPARRGKFLIEAVYLRGLSRWGLWQRQLRLPCQSRVDVYPDLKQLGEYALLARTNRLSLMGVRRTRRIGQDNEFERLRDYTPDDNYRHIDWRSTARRNKLTVKDFQSSQSQRIIFLVDCGRMMTGEAAGVSLLDHALNAALLLSFVALRQGDHVGLVCFSDRIHSFIPPKGGREQMNRLLHAAYDRFPAMVESRYDEAFSHVARHVRKRAMVVLITNLIDDVNADQVEARLANLSGRHLPLAVLLRDRSVFSAVEAVEPALEAAGAGRDTPLRPGELSAAGLLEDGPLFRAAAAADVLLWRRRQIARLESSGVLMVDAFPEDLTAPLVNRYLEVKARNLL